MDRLGKDKHLDNVLLTQAINDEMGSFELAFIKEGKGGNNMPIHFFFTDVLFLGRRDFIMTGDALFNDGKGVDSTPHKLKIFYDIETNTWFWIRSFTVNDDTYAKVISPKRLSLPEGNESTLLMNAQNKARLFAIVNRFIDAANSDDGLASTKGTHYIVKKLISHDINCKELLAGHIWLNVLKEGEFEWNKEENSRHQFSEDIINSNLVITMENVDEPHEVYAYFFFDIKPLKDGNKAYFLNKAIFDEKLTDAFTEYCIDTVFGHIADSDNLATDRICIGRNESYPFIANKH